MIISTLPEIEQRLDFMHTWQTSNYSDEITAILDRMRDAEALMAESGKLLADAKYHYSDLLESKIMAALKAGYSDSLSASALNKLIASYCIKEKRLVDIADRVNASFVHQIDSMRTQISYIKTLNLQPLNLNKNVQNRS